MINATQPNPLELLIIIMPSLTRYYAMVAIVTTADTARVGMPQRRHAALPSMMLRKSGQLELRFTVASVAKLKL